MVEDGVDLLRTVVQQRRADCALLEGSTEIRIIGPDQTTDAELNEHVEPAPQVISSALFLPEYRRSFFFLLFLLPVVSIQRGILGCSQEVTRLARFAMAHLSFLAQFDLNPRLIHFSSSLTHVSTTEAEIEKIDASFVAPSEVGSLDVPVDDADLMHVLECLKGLDAETKSRFASELRMRAKTTKSGERTADEGHDHHVERSLFDHGTTGDEEFAEVWRPLEDTELEDLVAKSFRTLVVNEFGLHRCMYAVFHHLVDCSEATAADLPQNRPAGDLGTSRKLRFP